MKDIAVKVIFLFVLMCLKHIQSLKDYTLMFMLAKDYCLCGAKYGEEAHIFIIGFCVGALFA